MNANVIGLYADDIGFEEFINLPNVLDRVSLAVSANLWNMRHKDLDDNRRSWAIWLRQEQRAAPDLSWWFLFPDHSIAIQLEDGIRMSWDGRHIAHCSVSSGYPEGDRLLSFFVGEYSRCRAADRRIADFHASVRLGEEGEYPFSIGDAIWVAWYPGRRGFIRARAYIVDMLPNGGMLVAWHRNSRDVTTYESAPMLGHAGRVARVPSSMVGEGLVGARICVYNDVRDDFTHGTVSAYLQDGHLVTYDSGDNKVEQLFHHSGRPKFVLECSML